jgi:hypothetical protein
MKKFLILIAFTALCYQGLAQSVSCAQTLRLAQSIYEQGRLHELEELISKALKNPSLECAKTDQVGLLKLLTLANIYLEDPKKADESMLMLLNINPYFEPNKDVDPAEFVALYNTFRTQPVFRLGIKFGANSSRPNVTSFNPVSDGISKYKSNLGIVGGVVVEFPVSLKLILSGELLYHQKRFTNTAVSKFTTSENNANNITVIDYSSSTGIETQNYISLPLLVQYEISDKRKIIPYVELGVSTDYLLGAETSVERKRVSNQSIDVKSFSLSPQREKLNFSMIAGAGARTRIASGYLVANIRYSYGLTKVNSLSTLYTNQLLLMDYNINDGIFSLNSLYFTMGYVQNFFKPKKLNRK